jgi:hypothetical protein
MAEKSLRVSIVSRFNPYVGIWHKKFGKYRLRAKGASPHCSYILSVCYSIFHASPRDDLVQLKAPIPAFNGSCIRSCMTALSLMRGVKSVLGFQKKSS